MKYGIIKNDAIANEDIVTETELRQRFKNTSIPVKLTASILERLNVVELPYPDLASYGLAETAGTVIATRAVKDADGNWKREPYLVHVDEESSRNRLIVGWQRLKNWRNITLRETDFREFDSYTKEDKQAWVEYRQALRDLPEQGDDPWQIVLPIPPSANTD